MGKQAFFIQNWTTGQLNALVKTLGEDNARGIIDGTIKFQLVEPEKKWQEKEGVIRLSVTSDGTTGSEWIKRLEEGGYRVSDYAKQLLSSDDFRPTDGITYQIAIMKGELFSDTKRITKMIRTDAERRGFQTPNAEVACLLREALSDEDLKELGLLWIVTMHEPIKDSGGAPGLLRVGRGDDGHWLRAYWDDPDYRWYRGDGFAFVLSHSTLD